MTDTEITVLAREYAEETVSHTRLSTTIAEDTEDVIRFLLRRYCLVEKRKQLKWIDPNDELPELRERVLICERVANQYKVFIGKRIPFNDGWEWNQSKKESVVAWMPLPEYNHEIAKEVES